MTYYGEARDQICAALGIAAPDNITKHLASLTDAEMPRFVIALSCGHERELIALARRHCETTRD